VKSVTGAELCRALARNGRQLVRTRGSHQTWSKSGHPSVTVPVHKGQDLKKGMLATLLKQTGLGESDL
jgi:predicted RNA binding protein YcfA (HicA-like mRNA interferase family)